MRQTPDTGANRNRRNDPPDPAEQGPRHLDLSVPQVAGSALAAVAAAVLASRLGVYGTIIGAGVVSIVATCGGSVFQHLFSRTGDQLRDSGGLGRSGRRRPKADRAPEPAAAPDGAFGAATIHGTRVRGWRRPVAAAAVVFGVAMAGITGYEMLSGSGLDGGKGTTVGTVVRGGTGGGDSGPPREPSRQPDTERDRHREDGPAPGGTPTAPPPAEEGEGSGPGREDGSPEPPAESPAPDPTGSPGTSPTSPTSPAPPPPGTGGDNGAASGADGGGTGTGTGKGSGTPPGAPGTGTDGTAR
ncbi:hypothetical protein [Streptomyces sp. NPDC058953]|uniref:hypothetical protein n=1 Tax=unclassified Streptomyces TaxID=2593676 RepID=UPI0036C1EA69